MKKFIIGFWHSLLQFVLQYYQRMTGPTYPKRINITVNNTVYELKLVRSLSLNEKSEVKLEYKRYECKG